MHSAFHTGRQVFSVGLQVEERELMDEGVAWRLFHGWGGLRHPRGWSANIPEEMGHLRLDTPCAGVVVWFVLCTELYFHARDTYGALHMEPTGTRLSFMRAAFSAGCARLILGMDSDGQAVPDPIDDVIRAPRESILSRQELGPIRAPMHSAAVGALLKTATSRTAVARPRPGPGPRPRGPVARLPRALRRRPTLASGRGAAERRERARA